MMQRFSSRKFEGSYQDISFHTMICFDASYIKRIVADTFQKSELKQYDILEDETYELIDWLTREMVVRAFPHVRIIGHFHSDKFQQFYDQQIFGYEFRLRGTVEMATFLGPEARVAKVLCMDERSLIALGM